MIRRLIPLLALLTSIVRADQAVLDAWLKRQSTIQSLEVSFTQERKLPSLKQPVTTPGKLCFAKPGMVRWELGDPPATVAISDGSQFTLIDTAAKSARRISVDSPQAARFSMLTGKGFQTAEDFYQMFEVIETRVDSGIHQFTLKPKDRRTRGQVPWVFLNIDPANNELRAMEMELQDKSRIRTLFTKPKFNGKLPLSTFQADLAGFTVK